MLKFLKAVTNALAVATVSSVAYAQTAMDTVPATPEGQVMPMN